MDATEGIDASVLSIWLGVCMDGLPEAVLIGLLAQQHHMSVPFIASVFIANFPVRPPPVLPSFPLIVKRAAVLLDPGPCRERASGAAVRMRILVACQLNGAEDPDVLCGGRRRCHARRCASSSACGTCPCC
jgi:hypothetical protein